jgi:glycosyltransferase involved in cell wall biosynthesis
MIRLRVCIVGLKGYDLLANLPRARYFGGAERQQVVLARGLAARGHDVSFVTLDYGQTDGTIHEGVRVYKAYAPDDGIPALRFLHPRWSGLAAALRRADPDVVYQMGADSETGQIAAWCRLNRRTFVFSMASDADVDPALPLLRSRRQRVLYRAGLRYADAVVAQTTSQRTRLREVFAVDSTVIRNCSRDPGFDPELIRSRAANERPRLLWVGRFVPVKRLELLLDLAAAHPQWDFHIVGAGDTTSEYVRVLQTRAAVLSNAWLHAGIGDAALDEQYRLANALVCTSSIEGVPTTFLEAWARGLPVISTVDPDNAITAAGLGAAAAPEGLASAAQTVLAADQQALAGRIRRHFVSTHTEGAFVGSHEELFLAVTRAAAAQGA